MEKLRTVTDHRLHCRTTTITTISTLTALY